MMKQIKSNKIKSAQAKNSEKKPLFDSIRLMLLAQIKTFYLYKNNDH